MQQCCTSGSVEGVVGDHDSYSDRLRRMAVTEGNRISFLLAKLK